MSGCRKAVLLSLLVLGSAGCSKIPDWDERYGPGPNMSSESVADRIRRQEELMTALRVAAERSRAGAAPVTVKAKSGAGDPPPIWYEAALYGFNYADEECNQYLRLNFRLTRMRDRDRAIFGQVTSAAPGLLKAASVADPTITTIGAALGLGQGLTDAYMNSYLFTAMEPNVVFNTVAKLQNAYRSEAEGRSASFTSSAIAYRSIQNYYSLCFPQTIEAKMSEYLAKSITDTEKGSAPKPAVVKETDGAGLTSSAATIAPKLASPE